MSDQSNLIKLTGLWIEHDRHGQPYFAGGFGQGRVLIFKNTKRPDTNDPDYILYIAPRLASAGEPADDDTGAIPF